MPDFNRWDWCWKLEDGRVWSTKTAAFADQDAVDAWLAGSGLTEIPSAPADEAGEHSEAGLRAALAFYGLPPGALVSLDEARAAKLAEIIGACDAALSPLAASFSAMERETWDQQVGEAQALQTGKDADAPLLRAIAASRGMDVLELAGRVMANKAGLEVVSGAVLGQKQAYEDRLAQAADVEAVRAIEVRYALPGM